jgi:hypothetical protein
MKCDLDKAASTQTTPMQTSTLPLAAEAATPQTLYERDGFYRHTTPVLTPELLDRAPHGLDAVRDGNYETGQAPDGRGWNPGDDPRALVKLEQPQLASYALREAIASSTLGKLAAAISGAQKVQVWWVQGLIKPGTGQDGGASTNVGWHQDQTYWDAWEEGSELFTAWLALSDVSPQDGPMVFVPGSHRWGLLAGGDFFGQDQDALKQAIAIPHGESWREELDALPSGGVSFHHRLLFHGSHQNVSHSPRRSLAIHLRTEKSRARSGTWVEKYLDDPNICPIIFER